MIVGLGVDLFDVSRMEAGLRQADPGFARQIFTDEEIADCGGRRRPAEHYAARFAAKEAVVKALALDGAAGLCWPEIAIGRTPEGALRVALHGQVRRAADRLGVTRVHLSMARARGVALASVVLESSP